MSTFFLFLTLFRDIFNTECQVSKPYLFFSNFHIHELSKNVKKWFLTPLPKKRRKKLKPYFFLILVVFYLQTKNIQNLSR